jgi:hypothetical protein
MQDMQTHLEKLHRDAVDCALISKRATDAQKKELFDRLADHLAMLASGWNVRSRRKDLSGLFR